MKHSHLPSPFRTALLWTSMATLTLLALDASSRGQDPTKPEAIVPVNVLKGHTERILSVVVSPDGRRVLSASQDQTIRLWNIATGGEVCRLLGHRSLVRSVVFSADGDRALSGSYDGTVRLWDVEKAREMARFDGHE